MKDVLRKIKGYAVLTLVIIGAISLPFTLLGLVAGAFKDDK